MSWEFELSGKRVDLGLPFIMWKITLAFSLFVSLAVTAGESPKQSGEPPKKGSSVTVYCHGRLRHGVASIGGETTGTTLTFQKQVWELKLTGQSDEEFAKSNHKAHVTAIGTLRKVAATETKVRWILDASSIEKRDPQKTPDGAHLSIRGKLRSDHHDPKSMPTYTIEAAGLVWPIEFGKDSALQSVAKTLVDESVNIEGDLQFHENEHGQDESSILVSKLDSVVQEPLPSM